MNSLRISSLDSAPFDTNKLRNPQICFCHCNCVDYLHYRWCVHVCVDAFNKKLISGYPRTLDPTPIGDRARGRIPNIVRGGALGRR